MKSSDENVKITATVTQAGSGASKDASIDGPYIPMLFATSQIYKGNELGGLAGAAEKCRSLAAASSLNINSGSSGKWTAFTGTAKLSGLQQFGSLTQPVINVKGELIKKGGASLFDPMAWLPMNAASNQIDLYRLW